MTVNTQSEFGSFRDWRSDDYRYVLGLTYDARRWEFLRRNPDYQREWSEELPSYLEQLRESPTLGVHSPDHPKFRIPSLRCAENWRLASYINPAQDQPWRLSFTDGLRFYPHRAPDGGPGRMLVEFDLENELHGQISQAKEMLLDYQRMRVSDGQVKVLAQKASNQPSKWPLYLRLLDAVAGGGGLGLRPEHGRWADCDALPHEEIAEELGWWTNRGGKDVEDGKRVKRTLEAARAMTRPEGYLKIRPPKRISLSQ